MRPKIFSRILLVGFVFLQVACTALWVFRDAAPPAWDEAWYLEAAVRLFECTEEGPHRFALEFMRAFTIKAPLISVLPLPFFALFGAHEDVAMLVQLTFIIAGDLTLFCLARQYLGELESLLTVVIMGTFPVTLVLQRHYLVEYGLTCFVLLWMYLLTKSDLLRRRRICVLMGGVLGLGLLMKILFPMYVALPTLIVLIAGLRAEGRAGVRALVVNVVLLLLVGLGIASVWYVPNLYPVMQFALSTSFGAIAQDYALGDPWALSTIGAYWRDEFVNDGVSGYYALLLAVLGLAAIVETARRHAWSRPGLWQVVLTSWFIVPALVLVVSTNKSVRFLFPALPPLAMLLARLLWRMLGIGVRRYLVLALVVVPLSTLVLTLSPGYTGLLGSAKGLDLFLNVTNYVEAVRVTPNPVKWPTGEIAQFVTGWGSEESVPRLYVLVDHVYLNQNSLAYYGELAGEIDVRGSGWFASDLAARDALGLACAGDWLMMKTNDLGPAFLNTRNAALRDSAMTDDSFRLVKIWALPDGSEALLYRRREE